MGRWKRRLLLTAVGGSVAGLAVGTRYFFGGHARPDINGEWRAEVTYDWPGANHVEHFIFAGEANDLSGSASFLGVARGIVEGRIEAGTLRFSTLTSEVAGSGPPVQRMHRYRGTVQDAEIRFVMQTEGGVSVHVPVEFTARRVAPASTASR